jgi:thiol-disulfide isomerase/thioredoxin
MGKLITNLLFFVAILVLGWFVYVKMSAAGEGDQAPQIQAELVNGKSFELSELKGDYVLLSFWASWCGPCRAKSPSLIAFHQKYKDKVKIVSVALEKDQAAGIAAAKRDGFTWEYQIVEESSFVMTSGTAQDYGVSSIPTMFLISPEGVLLGEKSLKDVEKIIGS